MRDKQLLPIRYPQGELFLCDLGDVALKDDTATMEHPIFALSTKPDLNERQYEHNGNRVTVTPSTKGLATIYDKDVLIFAISQIMAAKNQGLPYSREVSFSALDFLKFANRMTNGQAYKALRETFKRLRGTTIETDIITGGVEQSTTFGLIDEARVRRTLKNGTVTDWGITLSEWLFNAIEADEVLTLHKDYFRLRKPLERRIYEIARKHCGVQKQWKINLPLLKKKSGSQTTAKKFKQLLKQIQECDHLPDYSMHFEDGDFVVFVNRKYSEKNTVGGRLILKSDTYEKARRAAPDWDIYMLEQYWRGWINEKSKAKPDNPDAAFIGYCKKWFENKGRP